MRSVRHKVYAVQESLRKAIVIGDAAVKLDESDSLQELSFWMLSKVYSKELCDAQCKTLAVHPIVAAQVTPTNKRKAALVTLSKGFYTAITRIGGQKRKRVLHQLGCCFRVPGVDYIDFVFFTAWNALPHLSLISGANPANQVPQRAVSQA